MSPNAYSASLIKALRLFDRNQGERWKKREKIKIVKLTFTESHHVVGRLAGFAAP